MAGALGGDVAGWTVPTSTAVLPILLPQLTGVVKSMRAWMKLYLQYGVALMTEKAGGATYVPLLPPVLGNNLEDAPNQLPGRSHLINWQCQSFGRLDVPLVEANAFGAGLPPAPLVRIPIRESRRLDSRRPNPGMTGMKESGIYG